MKTNITYTISYILMAIIYILAGINHFISPQTYLNIMPAWLPYPKELIFLSGVCEILFGLLLLPVSTRRVGAWLIIALLIAVFPANIQMAINYYSEGAQYLWLAILRLPIQAILIFWAYRLTKPQNHIISNT